jgi:D-cysteine desulfhydrase
MNIEKKIKDYETPITYLGIFENNTLYTKREDMIPYSFGGNKARKSLLFFEEIDKRKCDSVVTYGSSHSNHCRVVANMAAQRNIPCYIISPNESSDETYNSVIMDLLGAYITTVNVDDVHDTIENKLKELKALGKNPFFIQGGGHGNIGTQAYVECYNEIIKYELENNIFFDYIFLASGTGTTQAGLVCGQLMNRDERKIIGISIARKNPRGRNVVIDSIKDYLLEVKYNAEDKDIEQNTIFLDDFVTDGYGKNNLSIDETIKYIMIKYGIPLDSTYTGKAFWGMENYLVREHIEQKNVLFIHTGGTPLFFDDLNRIAK